MRSTGEGPYSVSRRRSRPVPAKPHIELCGCGCGNWRVDGPQTMGLGASMYSAWDNYATWVQIAGLDVNSGGPN